MRECINDLDGGGVGSVSDIASRLRAAGIKPNVHVGVARLDFTPEMTIEWYAGSIVNVLESRAFECVNSLINCVDKFCPEVKP